MNELTDRVVIMVLQAVLAVVVPALGAALVVYVQKLIGIAKNKLTNEQYELAKKVIETLVLAAESNGLNGYLLDIGKEKKEWVVEQADILLKSKGISLPVDEIDNMIESAVMEIINIYKESKKD